MAPNTIGWAPLEAGDVPKMADRVLLTGGSGFIGSAMVLNLLKRGYAVRVLDDNSRGNPRRLASVMQDIEFVPGDVRDEAVVDQATRGVDIVAHLAFVNGTEYFYTKPKLVLEVGVKGSLNTLESAIKHGVREYWYMSSSEVYQTPAIVPTDENVAYNIPDPLNPRYSYGGGKIAGELLTINYGRDAFERTVVVRPHNVYGPDMGFEHVIPQFAVRAAQASEAQPTGVVSFPIQGDGSQMRSFVYVDDFAEGAVLAFTKGDKLSIYHVGTMEERTIGDVATAVLKHLGRDVKLEFGELPKGGTERRCPDISKVAALGYSPKVGFDEGLGKTVDWYAGNKDLWPVK